MPPLRRSAKKDPAVGTTSANLDGDALNVDDSARALESVATNLEILETNRDDGSVAAVGVVPDATAMSRPGRPSKLPIAVQFPLVTILSFSISSLGYSFLNEWSGGELANVGKTLNTWEEVGALAGWRIVELALGWFAGFDSLDVAALNLLAHGPAISLLSTFYNISTPTALSALGIEMLSTFAPFQLLRPLSGAHVREAKNVANREILTDIPIQAYTTLLSAMIYGITLFSALHTYLPTSFAVYFEGLPDLTPAYTANYLSLLPVALAFGFAARSFIFTPFTATGRSKEDGKLEQFDPVTATLGETVLYNLWGYTTRGKVIILRTAVVMVMTGISTYLQCFMTIGGVEPRGAASYAGPWVVASFLTGVALAFVGEEP
ncbi:hypothetical protein SODALDRAFT_328066 [Sodiomyces alkalinus F11]|uniref:Uncharacterized protein n=1 Tax=Sodiomyces alkalinus (strain CBS 110278 / VKM F-3762 / F11) TaxID=1314773 RepID=A0A3N2PMI8_SODAK|nr:hypothetical protein SODALDRAFT_328066 [Sodiomyces alkalinus F11]ROT35689.1 hypothetical protein SODALDRAFT_328066 [Sodiomyces alkalinus F11]